MRIVFTRLLAAILLVLLLVPELPISVSAAERAGGVTLKDADSSALLPFQVPNMFPGDSVTKEYVVTVEHSYPITLHYHADIRPDERYQKLAEVLKICIRLPEKGITLYDGLLRDMPSALSHDLGTQEKTLTYRITVSLDTGVGNEYMDKDLIADFRWWYIDEEGVAVKLIAEKTMNDRYASGSDFLFQLKDPEGNLLQSVHNTDGHIEFDTLYFQNPGTYAYTISEIWGRDDNITYDTAVYQAIIDISPQGEAYISYTRNGLPYDSAVLPRFTNVTRGSPVPDHPSDVNPENPKTGDDFPVMLYSVIALSSLGALICLFVLWKDRKRKGEAA